MAHIRRVDNTIHINLPGVAAILADGFELQVQVKAPDGFVHSATVTDGKYTETTQTPIAPIGKTQE